MISGGTASLNRGGRFDSSVNCCNVSLVPGATSSPSRTCLADDNSPRATFNSARAAHHRLDRVASCVQLQLVRHNAHWHPTTSTTRLWQTIGTCRATCPWRLCRPVEAGITTCERHGDSCGDSGTVWLAFALGGIVVGDVACCYMG